MTTDLASPRLSLGRIAKNWKSHRNCGLGKRKNQSGGVSLPFIHPKQPAGSIRDANRRNVGVIGNLRCADTRPVVALARLSPERDVFELRCSSRRTS